MNVNNLFIPIELLVNVQIAVIIFLFSNHVFIYRIQKAAESITRPAACRFFILSPLFYIAIIFYKQGYNQCFM